MQRQDSLLLLNINVNTKPTPIPNAKLCKYDEICVESSTEETFTED